MGMEDMGLEVPANKRVIMPGEPGYKSAWDASRDLEPSKDQLRDAAINSADIGELEEALGHLENKENPDATTLEALTRVRARIDELIKKNQN